MKVLDYLSNQGVDFSVRHHPQWYTAQREAGAQHLSGHMFAKTVIVRAGERYAMLVLPACYQVDLQKAGRLLGGEPRLASEGELAELFTDCDLGAEPPFGSKYGLATLVDEHLAAQPSIAMRGGSHHEVVLLAWRDFARLESPRVAAFAR